MGSISGAESHHEVDGLSDPRDESRWSADDLLSMGALHTPEITALLDDTPALRDLDLGASGTKVAELVIESLRV